MPQIELTEGQRREGAGLLLVVLAALVALAIVFSPGAELTRVRGYLLDAVGLGWLAVVMIMMAGGVSMIRGRRAAGDGSRVTVSRNQGAVFVGMALLVVAVLGLLQLLLLPPADWTRNHQQAGGIVGAVVAGSLNNILTAWGAAIVLAGGAVFGAMLSFDLSLAAIAERIRPAEPEAVAAEPEPEAEPPPLPRQNAGWNASGRSPSPPSRRPQSPLPVAAAALAGEPEPTGQT